MQRGKKLTKCFEKSVGVSIYLTDYKSTKHLKQTAALLRHPDDRRKTTETSIQQHDENTASLHTY